METLARRTVRASLAVLVVLSATSRTDLSSQGASIGGYQLVSQEPVKNTTLFIYRATLTNGGGPLSSATATARNMGGGAIKLLDNSLTFGPVAAGGAVVSTDTFSFTRNGNTPPDLSKIVWTITPQQNQAPLANAGPDQTLPFGSIATLDGSASSDADGHSLSYSWSFESIPLGSQAVLSNSSAVHPSFAIDRPGSYVVSLRVNDGLLNSAPDTVTIATQNSAPVANAGPDQTAAVGQTVTLDGRSSTDVDGDALAFSWAFVSRPPQSGASLVNPNTVNPRFVVDVPGTYLVGLVVHDGKVVSAIDTVAVNTVNSAPVANAGLDQTAYVNDTVTLNGSGSTDVDGDQITYRWSLVSVPAESNAALSNAAAITPTFTIDKPGVYVAQLIVNDGSVDSAPDSVEITTQNSPPVADAGPNQTAAVGQLVLLDGTGSADVDGDPLSFQWSFTTIPANSAATLTNPTTAVPFFTVDLPGTYIVQLIVNDGLVNSPPAAVTITTTNSTPRADAGPDQLNVLAGDLVTLDGTQSTDPDGDPLSYSWSLITSPPSSGATLAGALTSMPTFTPDLAGDYVAQLIVNDGTIDSNPDTVLIRVSPRPTTPPIANAGPDQQVFTGDVVSLDASASSDPDGTIVAASWSFTSTPAGSAAVLQNATTMSPTFTADIEGAYVVEVTVTDNGGATSSDSVVVNVTDRVVHPVDEPIAVTDAVTVNGAPLLDPLPNLTVDAETDVRFTAIADDPGDALAFSLVGAPDGATIHAGTGAFSWRPTPAQAPDTYAFFVRVMDSGGLTAEQPITIDVRPFVYQIEEAIVVSDVAFVNGAPLLDPLADATVEALSRFEFTAIARDPGDAVLFALVDAPAGAEIDAGTGAFSWIPALVQAPGVYSFFVQVTDSGGLTAVRPITITVAPYVHVIDEHITVSDEVVNLPVLTVSALDPDAAETFLDPGTVRITRENETAGALTVAFTIGGSATNGVDYQLVNTSASFAPGQAFVDVPIMPIGDSLVEGLEDVSITLLAGEDHVLGPTPTATVMIADKQPIGVTLVGSSVVVVSVPATLQLTLGVAAPSGGVVVTVTSADTDRLTVEPSAITIAQGQTVGEVTLNGLTSGTVTVRANSPHFQEGTLAVTVVRNIISVPATLNVPLGQPTDLPITIVRDANYNGDVVVNVASDNPAAVAVSTPTVTIPAGQLSANGTVFGQGVGSATFTATAQDFAPDSGVATPIAALDITAAGLTINSVMAGSITIELESPPGSPFAAPAGGVLLNLTADDPGCVAIPATVTIAAGTASETAEVTYAGTTAVPCSTTVTASGPNGITGDALTINVNPAPGITLSPPGSVGGGLQAPLSGVLGASQHGGVRVHLTSGDPLILLAPNATTAGTSAIDIDLVNGQTGFSFYAQAADWTPGTSTEAAVTVTATAPGFTDDTATVNYVQGGVAVTGLLTSMTALQANDDFVVEVGIPGPSGVSAQARRVGAGSLLVTVTNSDAAVGEIDPNGGADPGTQIQTAAIAAQASTTPFNTAGGLEFDPKGAGSTTVSATIPGFLTTAAATRSVLVSAIGGISLPASAGSVGGGLQQSSPLQGSFGAQSNHGGVTVTLVSGDPRILVARNAIETGAASITIPVANGTTTFQFVVQGTDWVDGTSMPATDIEITASAPGFASGTTKVDYVQPGLALAGLVTSTTTLSVNDDFSVTVGIQCFTCTPGVNPQPRRAGGEDLPVTVTNSDATVAEIDPNGGANPGSQSRTSKIVAGATGTPFNTVDGLEFDPIGAGTTTVGASIPGFIRTTPATQAVTVTASAPLTMPVDVGAVGSGLQSGAISGTLGASNHGGVTVTVASGDSRILVAPNGATVGTPSIQIPVPNGQVSFLFVLQAADWIEGTALNNIVVTASAPGFTTGTSVVDYVQAGVALSGLTASSTTLAVNDDFQVLVGAPSAGTVSAQARRAGAGSLTATVTNSNAAVAEIDPNGGANPGLQSRTSTIVAGASGTPFNTSGGLEFDPLSTGTTIVSASIPGFVSTAAASQTVPVTTSVISMPASASVGSGLQSNNLSGTLGGPEHGGVKVTLVSSDPARVLISPNATTVGSASIEIQMLPGQTGYSFIVQGTDWVEGSSSAAAVTVTASAPGFITDSTTVQYVQAGVAFLGLTTPTTASAVNDDFIVQIGVPSVGTVSAQTRRAGAAALTVTVTNSNAAVGEIDPNGGANPGSQSRTATIVAGSSGTPLNISGGLEFDPLGVGETIVTASIPGFLTTPAGTQTVKVNP